MRQIFLPPHTTKHFLKIREETKQTTSNYIVTKKLKKEEIRQSEDFPLA